MSLFPDPKTFIELGPLSIQWYAVFIMIGATLCYKISQNNFVKNGYSKDMTFDYFLNVLFVGIVGARIWYVIFMFDQLYKDDLFQIFMIQNGGLAIQGGVIAGLIYSYYFFKKLGIRFLDAGDYIMPNLLLAQACGRWGNFVNKEAFGGVVDRSFLESLFIPEFIIEGMKIEGFYYHPTFLYESIFNLVGFILIVFILKKVCTIRGIQFYSYFVWYGVVRFFVESLRADSLYVFGLRTAQITSLVFLVIGIVGILTCLNRNKVFKDYVVMFDLDGTLIDTNELIRMSFIHTFSVHKPGFVLTEDMLVSFLGPTLEDTFSKYFPVEEIDGIVNTYRTFNKEKHDDYVGIYEGVVSTLDKLKQLNYPMAIITSKRNDVAMMGLKKFNLQKYFDIVIGYEDVKIAKPDPEGVYKVLKYFNCSKGVMVGDNATDLLAGLSANIDAVGVAWSEKGVDSLLEVKPNKVIDSMLELIEFIGG